MKILFIGATPSDLTHLRLDKEIRTIREKLQQTSNYKSFVIEQEWAIRVTDLQGIFLRHKPNIVHFSGHGNDSGEIIIENSDGESYPISIQALTQLFSEFTNNIECVVLNACYSETQGTAIAQHIQYVIGMSDELSDDAAISFSFSFYQALGFGEDIKKAFNLGCIQIGLENLKEQKIPKLLERSKGKNMSKLPIKIIQVGDLYEDSLKDAINLSNSIQNEFEFELLESDFSDEIRMHTFNKIYVPDYLDMLESKRALCNEDYPYVIVITESSVDGKKYSNLFGSDRPEKGLVVVTTHNVPDIIIPSDRMTSYFLYYLAKYTMCFIYPSLKNHDDTRSCVFDRKIHKPDLVKSMKARSICDDCRKKFLLSDSPISATQFQALDRIFSLSGKTLSNGNSQVGRVSDSVTRQNVPG